MSSLLEIVELMSGEIVLQRADGEGEPLLELRFSEEAAQMLGEAQIEVARAMIHAGIEVVAESQTGSLPSKSAMPEPEGLTESDTTPGDSDLKGTQTASASDSGGKPLSGNPGNQSLDGIKASDLASNRVLH